MSTYRAYVVTLTDPAGREVMHLRTWPDLLKTLAVLERSLCRHGVDAHPDTGITVRVEREWLTDGFLSAPPHDYTTLPARYESACPARILAAL